MQSAVRTALNESTAVFFSDADIQESLNDGYAEMCDATECYEREAMLPSLASRTYHDLSTILPDIFLSPRRVFNVTTNQWLSPASPRQLDDGFLQWELVPGEPQRMFMRGNWWLGTFPKPSADGLGYRLYYSSIAPEMVDDTDEPVFPREFHQGIVVYALSDLNSQQRETANALMYWGIPRRDGTFPKTSYKAYENGLKSYVEGRTSLAGTRSL